MRYTLSLRPNLLFYGGQKQSGVTYSCIVKYSEVKENRNFHTSVIRIRSNDTLYREFR